MLLAGSMWFYVRRVLVPYQRADAVLHGRPRGNLSDLYPRWIGARELLLHHRDPYTPAVAREIQIGYYGRPLDPDRPSDPKDQQGFAYPVYVAFFLAPTLNIPFSFLQIGFRWVLLILTAITVPLWLRAIGWSPRSMTVLLLAVLTLGSFPVAQGVELQQLSLLVNALLAACLVLIGGGHLLLAGGVLAIATIKPQLAFPIAAWLALWAFSNWRERRKLIYGFLLTMLVLVLGGELVLPGWIGRFMQAIAAYRQYTNSRSILDVLAGNLVGRLLAVIVIIIVGIRCWQLRRESHGTISFWLSSALILTTTIVIVPTFAPYNQILLLPGIFLLIEGRSMLNQTITAKALAVLAAVAIFWPWVASLGLTIASFILPAARVQQAWTLPFYTSIATPLAVLGLLFQYAFQVLPSSQSLKSG